MIIFIKWMPQHTIFVHKMAARTIIICLKKPILHSSFFPEAYYHPRFAIFLGYSSKQNPGLQSFFIVVSENVKFYFLLKINMWK